jgi:CO dehydrogenase maturation factor
VGSLNLSPAVHIDPRLKRMSDEKDNRIVVTGRGGTGKSTFTALMSRHLGETGVEPLLLVDSDPDESLAEMLGVDIRAEGKETISETLWDILQERKMAEMKGMTPTEKIEPYLFQNNLYEGMGWFDLIALGTKWHEGCYCLPDHSLAQIMDKWADNYAYVIVDSPAGVEHLNRKISKRVKNVYNILGASKKSFDNAKRSYKIMQEVGIAFDSYYLVGGYTFSPDMEEEAMRQPFEYLGRIAHDEDVRKFNIEGRSLLELPDDSPAYQSIRQIMKKAGYKNRTPPLTELLKPRKK